MKWISVIDQLPKAFEPCWIFWRDRQVLIGWRTVEPTEAGAEPNELWYSTEDEKCRWTNWWMPIQKPGKPNEA